MDALHGAPAAGSLSWLGDLGPQTALLGDTGSGGVAGSQVERSG